MGKKSKTGKSRRDKFYHLAKETGFRARSAFKLLQLNRKYEFLQKSRVCIDLCAAPGGWLQVAQQHMPMSSLILGVDLVSIKPIHNVVTFQHDITTDKCRSTLKKELQTWKADVVLHDGAPNVGKSWSHDAYMQGLLTLQALKLATEFLKKGGWFVTKVFRSKDYHALMWVFKQLFKKVHATKPQASRNESAEIFVVCQWYRAPDKLDPKFTDPKYVFQDVEGDAKGSLNLIHPEKVKKRALGYADGDLTLHHKVNASDFIAADNFLEILADCNELVLDDQFISKHPATTTEVTECCQDIKVLGKKDIKNLISWRKKLREYLEKQVSEEDDSKDTSSKKAQKTDEEEMDEGEEEQTDEEDDEVEMEDDGQEESEEEQEDDGDKVGEKEDEEELELKEQIASVREDERKDLKKKRKKVMKEKRKLRDKMSLGMSIPGDRIETTDDIDLFNLQKIKRRHDLVEVAGDKMADASESDDDDDEELIKNKRIMMSYDRYANEVDDDDQHKSDEDEDSGEEGESDDGDDDDEDDEQSELEMESDDEDEKKKNPLIVDLETQDVRVKRKTDMWFKKDVFDAIDGEEDEDVEVETAMEDYRKRGGVILGQPGKQAKKRRRVEFEDPGKGSGSNDVREEDDESSDDSEEEESSSDESEDDNYDADVHFNVDGTRKSANNSSKKDGFEVVPIGDTKPKKIIKLDAVELAMGEEMIKSSKRRREMIEDSFNRYMFDDENVPDWFHKDERKHMKKQIPVTKEKIDEYKEKQKAINARPIKKVAEANARKKKKVPTATLR